MKSWLRENCFGLLAILAVSFIVIAVGIKRPPKPPPVKEEARDIGWDCPKFDACMNGSLWIWPEGGPWTIYMHDSHGHKRTICYGYTASYCDESYPKEK